MTVPAVLAVGLFMAVGCGPGSGSSGSDTGGAPGGTGGIAVPGAGTGGSASGGAGSGGSGSGGVVPVGGGSGGGSGGAVPLPDAGSLPPNDAGSDQADRPAMDAFVDAATADAPPATDTGAADRAADAAPDGARDASPAADAGVPVGAYNPCPPAGQVCTIMPLGDSITDGYLALRGGYRVQFFHRGHMDGKQFTFVGSTANGPDMVDGVPFPRMNEGHSAYHITDQPQLMRMGIAPLMSTVIPRFHPDIVLLMIGTNDVDKSIDLPNLPNRLGTLIDSIITLDAHTLIVVAQITPTMQDPLNARIREYNAAIPMVVKIRADAGKHVVMIDMYNALASDPTFKTRYLYDRLHPNIPGYEKMGDTWYALVGGLLR